MLIIIIIKFKNIWYIAIRDAKNNLAVTVLRKFVLYWMLRNSVFGTACKKMF